MGRSDIEFCRALSFNSRAKGADYFRNKAIFKEWDGTKKPDDLAREAMSIGQEDEWKFGFNIDSNYSFFPKEGIGPFAPPVCKFDFIIEAYQANSDGTWGFTKTIKLSNLIKFKSPAIPIFIGPM